MTVIVKDILSEVALYYSEKITEHGDTPSGVDWNGEESQVLRFKQLCKIIDPAVSFSIQDLGCGYGALYNFLSQQYDHFSYLGIDVSENMIQAAKKRYQTKDNACFELSHVSEQVTDYAVASGIFNVRLERSDDEWKSYLETTLNALDKTTRIAFSFNCLTRYSDADKKKDYLYYADPCALFDFCKRRYSRNVALLHDYQLYEFTILVRKQS